MNIDVIPRIVRRALVSLLHLLANYTQNVRVKMTNDYYHAPDIYSVVNENINNIEMHREVILLSYNLRYNTT